jgi:hypothetical protein
MVVYQNGTIIWIMEESKNNKKFLIVLIKLMKLKVILNLSPIKSLIMNKYLKQAI